ncbi:MAG TPA: hypothetical protein VGV93_05205 [Acidimicrobiales bacterium]|nr:hypothetical protein [Acidimicrobiales bacterium]
MAHAHDLSERACGVWVVTTIESERAVAVPEQGNLVRVRDRFWVVQGVCASTVLPDASSSAGSTFHHRVDLVPIDDKAAPRR